MNTLHLKIITPERLVYESDISEFFAYTHSGKIGILPLHIPLITLLKAGEMIIKKNGVDLPVAVSGGILEVKPSSRIDGRIVTPVTVLADHLEFASDIDVEKSQEAYERAKQAMAQKGKDDAGFSRLQGIIEKELNRIKIGGKYKR